jgi:hypothetical protein
MQDRNYRIVEIFLHRTAGPYICVIIRVDIAMSALHHQRNKRGPNIAPASVQSTIVPPYQTATKGNESSVQCSAYAIALIPPATSPANAPAWTRLVGAALRTAHMTIANGTTAMIGIDKRH